MEREPMPEPERLLERDIYLTPESLAIAALVDKLDIYLIPVRRKELELPDPVKEMK